MNLKKVHEKLFINLEMVHEKDQKFQKVHEKSFMNFKMIHEVENCEYEMSQISKNTRKKYPSIGKWFVKKYSKFIKKFMDLKMVRELKKF